LSSESSADTAAVAAGSLGLTKAKRKIWQTKLKTRIDDALPTTD